MAGQPTTALAEFVVGLDLDDVPHAVRELAGNLVLDTVASALAGRHGDETPQVEALARSLAADATSTVIAGRPSSLVGATLLNAYQTTAVTICDIHKPMLNHVSPAVVPAALAIAERDGASGRALLTAVVAGVEVTNRVGLGLRYAAYRERGWHSPGVLGPFGAAAAVGHLLGLDADHLRDALGLAGGQSAGTFAAWGTPGVKFHQARGGVSGLLAALLAAQGFHGAPEVLAADDGGLLTTYSDGGDPSAITDGLGSTWTLPQLSLRRWPAAGQLQGTIASLLELAHEHDLRPRGVSRVEVRLAPAVVEAFGDFDWDTRFTARLSPRYVTSVVLHDRRCWLEQFHDDRRRDPDVEAFARDRVHVVADDALPATGTRVVVQRSDGSFLERRRDLPPGDAEAPLSRAELEAKLEDARAGVLDDAGAAELRAALERLEDLDDVRGLLRLVRAPA